MLGDPQSTVTSVGQVVSLLRDGIATIAVCYVGWKIRDWIQPAFVFFSKANLFMDTTSVAVKEIKCDMRLMMSNHLPHIAEDLRTLSGRHAATTYDITAADEPQSIPDSPSKEL